MTIQYGPLLSTLFCSLLLAASLYSSFLSFYFLLLLPLSLLPFAFASFLLLLLLLRSPSRSQRTTTRIHSSNHPSIFFFDPLLIRFQLRSLFFCFTLSLLRPSFRKAVHPPFLFPLSFLLFILIPCPPLPFTTRLSRKEQLTPSRKRSSIDRQTAHTQ